MKPCKICKNNPVKKRSYKGYWLECEKEGCCSGPISFTPKEAEASWETIMGYEPVKKPVSSVSVGGVILVICDDGSVFSRDNLYSYWEKIDPIPGTAADKESK